MESRDFLNLENKCKLKPHSIFKIFNMLNTEELVSLTLKNVELSNDNIIRIYKDFEKNDLAINSKYKGIKFRYCKEENTNRRYNLKSTTYYNLSFSEANKAKWVLIFTNTIRK